MSNDWSVLVSNVVAAHSAVMKAQSLTSAQAAADPTPRSVLVSPGGPNALALPTLKEPASGTSFSLLNVDDNQQMVRSMEFTPVTDPLPAINGIKFTTEEDALFQAASKLCEAVGGVDYRQIALESHQALDALLRMIRCEFDIAGKTEFLPASMFLKHAAVFHNLLDEGKRLLAASGYPVPVTSPLVAPPITVGGNAALASLFTAPSTRSSVSGASSNRVRNVSIDIPNGSNSSTTPRRSNSKVSEPAVTEQYDLRLMHNTFGESLNSSDSTNNVVRNMEDEITILKAKIEKLQAEKKAIAASNEKNAALIGQLKQRLGTDLDTIQNLQTEMESEIRQLAIQTGNAGVLSSPTKRDSNTATATSMAIRKIQIMHDSTDDDPDVSRNEAAGNANQSTESVPSAVHTAHIFPTAMPSVRYQKIESLYFDVYRGKGMEMLWNTLHCIFKAEYDKSRDASGAVINATTPQKISTPQKGDGEQAEGITPESDPDHMISYNVFKDHFYSHIVRKLECYDTFLQSLIQVTPLRSDYIANCLKSKMKPNSGVVKLLSRISNDRDAFELTLNTNYLGDGGLAPLIPILARLYRLQSLSLSDVGIKNSGAQMLSQALMHHPSLTSLDVSKNNISRTGGKELLSLAGCLPSLLVLSVSGTQIDPALQERIAKRIELNGQPHTTAVAGAGAHDEASPQ